MSEGGVTLTQNGVTTEVLSLSGLRKLYALLTQPPPKYPLMDKRGRVWDGPNVSSTITPEEFTKRQGGYYVPVKFMNELRQICAKHDRRERKAWRRYQRQKRKQ